MFKLPQEFLDIINSNPNEEIIYHTMAWDDRTFLGAIFWGRGDLFITNLRVIFYKKFLFKRTMQQIYIQNITGVELYEPNIFETWLSINSFGNQIKVLLKSKNEAFEIQEILNYLIN
jgi:hypothetical protein